MQVRELRTHLAIAILAATSATLVAAGQLSRRDADQLRIKVDAINRFSEKPGREPQRTTLTENEVNAYLAYDARDDIPEGVLEPSITILGTGRVSGRAVVDLDTLKKHKVASGPFDPINLLTGRVPVTATGVLTTNSGVGRFQLESAAVGGMPIPKMMLQELVGYYSRSALNPSGINIDDPFALPARIREIQVDRGQAIVVQ